MRHRQEQLGEAIAHELSDLIRSRMQDPRIGFASVTGVELSADLRHAKVYISVMGNPDEQKATMRALAHGAGFLRRELAQRLTIRHTPELIFRLDESIAEGAKIINLINHLQTDSSHPADSSEPSPNTKGVLP
jgi:ribosome-binding factor A